MCVHQELFAASPFADEDEDDGDADSASNELIDHTTIITTTEYSQTHRPTKR